MDIERKARLTRHDDSSSRGGDNEGNGDRPRKKADNGIYGRCTEYDARATGGGGQNDTNDRVIECEIWGIDGEGYTGTELWDHDYAAGTGREDGDTEYEYWDIEGEGYTGFGFRDSFQAGTG